MHKAKVFNHRNHRVENGFQTFAEWATFAAVDTARAVRISESMMRGYGRAADAHKARRGEDRKYNEIVAKMLTWGFTLVFYKRQYEREVEARKSRTRVFTD